MESTFVKRIPFVRALFPFLLGIVLSWEYGQDFPNDWWLSLTFLVLSILVFILYRYTHFLGPRLKPYAFGVLFFLLFFYTGGYRAEVQKLYNINNHFVQYGSEAFALVLTEDIQVKPNSYKALCEVAYVKELGAWKSAEGKIICYFSKKNASVQSLTYGDTLIGKIEPALLQPPRNPGEFNFQNFMALSGQFHQAFIEDLNAFIVLKKRNLSSFWDYVYFIQKKIRTLTEKYIEDPNARGIVYALLLGEKNAIDPDILQAYSKAGAMHVLAVSGLHVGIIFLLVSRLLKPLSRNPRGRMLIALLQIIGIWAFATVAGLGPSVRRASTMFSVIALGTAFQERPNVYNSLALSAFVILFINPLLVFHVGFQLSYSAVLGIVYIQPKLNRLIRYVPRGLGWAWDLTCVSVAAQLGTVLLTVFYFHQFPTYFIFSNLFIIPAITLALNLVLAFILLGFLHPLAGQYLGLGIEYFVGLLNQAVMFVEALPTATINYLWISRTEMYSLYILGLLLIACYETKSVKWARISLAGMIAFGIFILFENTKALQNEEITIYNVRNADVVEYRSGSDALLFSNLDHEKDYNSLSFSVYPRSWLAYGDLPRIIPFHDTASADAKTAEILRLSNFSVAIPTNSIPNAKSYGIQAAILTSAYTNSNLDWLEGVERIILSPGLDYKLRKEIQSRYSTKVHDVSKHGFLRLTPQTLQRMSKSDPA